MLYRNSKSQKTIWVSYRWIIKQLWILYDPLSLYVMWCLCVGSETDQTNKEYGLQSRRCHPHHPTARGRWGRDTGAQCACVCTSALCVCVGIWLRAWVCVMVCSLSVSAGSASLVCAETLRQENFGGRIIMVTRDNLLPYDKTRLSKVNYPNSVFPNSVSSAKFPGFSRNPVCRIPESWGNKQAGNPPTGFSVRTTHFQPRAPQQLADIPLPKYSTGGSGWHAPCRLPCTPVMPSLFGANLE